jgi:mannose-6-phosphate isomerase
MSIVSNGFLKGSTLDKIIDEYKDALLGCNVYNSSYLNFPLLVKIIDANDKLSVQVHPGDNYEGLEQGESGKTEMWYIIDAKPNASLIYGLKNSITKKDFLRAIADKNINSTLKMVPVKPGDSLYIPAGTVHAILDGILIAEIQQNSNTTYRVYDWDRVGKDGKSRELHLDKALDVIHFGAQNHLEAQCETKGYTGYTIKVLSKSKYFTVDELNISGIYRSLTDGSRFFIYMVIEGAGTIKYENGQLDISKGETLMIPASLGEYEITGNIKALKTYL